MLLHLFGLCSDGVVHSYQSHLYTLLKMDSQRNVKRVFVHVFMDVCVFFFFKQKTAYEIPLCDWSSDMCSSDLKKKTAYEIALCDLRSHVFHFTLVQFSTQ